jgi:hypothetical protein
MAQRLAPIDQHSLPREAVDFIPDGLLVSRVNLAQPTNSGGADSGNAEEQRSLLDAAGSEKEEHIACNTTWCFWTTSSPPSRPASQMSHDKQLVDSMTARTATRPDTLDVLVCSNLFGDILTDLGAASPVASRWRPVRT